LRKLVIKIIEDAGPEGIYQNDIVKTIGCSKGWISEILGRLEKEGLIRRIRERGKIKKVVLSKYLSPDIGRYVRIGFVRSSEYVFIPQWLKNIRGRGFAVETVIYDKVVDVVRDAVSGKIHFGFAPLYTVAIFKKLGFPIRAVSGAALDGARLFTRIDSEELGVIGTSELSTMEAVLSGLIYSEKPVFSGIRYYTSPEDALSRFIKGSFKSIVIWEPYATILEYGRGKVRKIRIEDHIGDYQCCLLITRYSDIDPYILESYIDSFRAVSDRINDLADMYSRIIGVGKDLIVKSSKSYIYTPYLDKGNIAPILRSSPIFLVGEKHIRSIIREATI
jgi:predicted transcriptional regulator